MISRYELQLSAEDSLSLRPDHAYRLYAWLLSQIPEEQGEILHIQEDHPISQYLSCDRTGKTATWHIALLNDTAHTVFSPAIENTSSIALDSGRLLLESINHEQPKSPKDFILSSKGLCSGRASLQLVSPTSFKQAGRYVIYPQERLILRSLINRWNSFCPDYPLDDEDAIQMLENGILITDYSLRTARYKLKNTLIPSFCGRISLNAKLPLALAELWNLLLSWAPYSGLGIKTALGMGGIQLVQQTPSHSAR